MIGLKGRRNAYTEIANQGQFELLFFVVTYRAEYYDFNMCRGLVSAQAHMSMRACDLYDVY
jgi:hypothetical protein